MTPTYIHDTYQPVLTIANTCLVNIWRLLHALHRSTCTDARARICVNIKIHICIYISIHIHIYIYNARTYTHDDTYNENQHAQEKGEYDKALIEAHKVLDIHVTQLGDEHPTTAAAMDALGTVYQKLGQFASAKQLHEKVWFYVYAIMLGEVYVYTYTWVLNIHIFSFQ